MNKTQLSLVTVALLLLVSLFFFGKTHLPNINQPSPTAANDSGHAAQQTNELLTVSRSQLSPARLQYLQNIENQLDKSLPTEEKLHVLHQLSRFWADSADNYLLYAFYNGEAAKLENSEKSLTFAARLFLNEMMSAQEETERQHWLAENAKDLFDKALIINPKNDSNRIGRGACYIFGQLSDNPMEGILPIREIAEKQPDNMYAQMVLALGGRKSGQYDKAIERLLLIVSKEPDNLEAAFQLAECYELKGDKQQAVRWYGELKKRIKRPEIREDLDKRISQLK
ncbi:MAG: tetratricopeptide repeat protein [Bacteroidota bacterium]